MTYKKQLTYKIQKTIHVVEFYDGIRADNLVNDLSRVPSTAHLIEVLPGDEEGLHTTLKFEEEEKLE